MSNGVFGRADSTIHVHYCANYSAKFACASDIKLCFVNNNLIIRNKYYYYY